MNLLLEIEKIVAEGAGAAGLAALLVDPARFAGRKVGMVITGGNIDPRTARVGDHARPRALGPPDPHARSRSPTCPAPWPGWPRPSATAGGNIVEMAHQRMFSDLSAKSPRSRCAVEARDRQHMERILAALVRAGHQVTRRPQNIKQEFAATQPGQIEQIARINFDTGPQHCA